MSFFVLGGEKKLYLLCVGCDVNVKSDCVAERRMKGGRSAVMPEDCAIL